MTDQPIEFTDRYQALGIPYPDPATVCKGQCDGCGVYPFQPHGYARFHAREGECVPSDSEQTQHELLDWDYLHKRHLTFWGRIRAAWQSRVTGWRCLEWIFEPETACGGWHFITCRACGGSGKRS